MRTPELSDNASSTASLPARVYDELRRRIISGHFPPGTRLRERELAEEFAVSRIPLREALPQLEANGFIRTLPRRGAVVTQLTLRDVEELFEVRLGLEVRAAKKAAERVGQGCSPEPVRLVMERAERAMADGDADEIAVTTAELHQAVVDLSDNALVSTMMRSILGRMQWIFRLTAERDPLVACEEHHGLLDAISDANPDLAAAIAYAHIERGRAPSLATLSQVLPAN